MVARATVAPIGFSRHRTDLRIWSAGPRETARSWSAAASDRATIVIGRVSRVAREPCSECSPNWSTRRDLPDRARDHLPVSSRTRPVDAAEAAAGMATMTSGIVQREASLLAPEWQAARHLYDAGLKFVVPDSRIDASWGGACRTRPATVCDGSTTCHPQSISPPCLASPSRCTRRRRDSTAFTGRLLPRPRAAAGESCDPERLAGFVDGQQHIQDSEIASAPWRQRRDEPDLRRISKLHQVDPCK